MKRPWNIINPAVYSLATYDGDQVNMNICTYVTCISMQPKLYAIAVYNNTKTLENLLKTDIVILQFLNKRQYAIVNVLGKKSGLMIDKFDYLRKKNLLQKWNDYDVLHSISAVVLLNKISMQQTGDHVLCTFEVKKYQTFNSDVLTSSVLRDKKIIRA